MFDLGFICFEYEGKTGVTKALDPVKDTRMVIEDTHIVVCARDACIEKKWRPFLFRPCIAAIFSIAVRVSFASL